jgi:hypothetical protein
VRTTREKWLGGNFPNRHLNLATWSLHVGRDKAKLRVRLRSLKRDEGFFFCGAVMDEHQCVEDLWLTEIHGLWPPAKTVTYEGERRYPFGHTRH